MKHYLLTEINGERNNSLMYNLYPAFDIWKSKTKLAHLVILNPDQVGLVIISILEMSVQIDILELRVKLVVT